MPKIKELLELNLDIDIKNVIDLEDQAEDEIRYEIDNYIVTENIGKHIATFASTFNSNIKETGVWVEALKTLSEQTQVIFHSHHDHLIPTVQDVFGGQVNVVFL